MAPGDIYEIKRKIKLITRWLEHNYGVYLRVEKCFTSERSERVKSFFHENINFICVQANG